MAVEKLEIETYFGKCKCCLNYGYLRTMWEKHVVDERSEIYGEMLVDCFSIEWTTKNSEEDDQICEDCIWKLREAFRFKKQVLQCQTEVKSMQVDEALEIKSEPDTQSYDAEYLDEEFLEEDYNNNGNSDEDSGEGRGSEEERQSPDDESSSGAMVFKEDNDDDENQNPEDGDDEDFIPDSPTPTPRKRRPRRSAVDDDDSDTDAPKPKWARRLPKQERWKTYKQYSDEAMADAVKAVISKSMSQNEASKRYKVPRKSLSVKVISYKNNEPLFPIKTHNLVGELKTLLSYIDATPFRSPRKRYCCFYCCDRTSFPDVYALKQHTKTNHNSETDLKKAMLPVFNNEIVKIDLTDAQCTVCSLTLPNWKQILQHLQTTHNVTFRDSHKIIPFVLKENKCILCYKEFNGFMKLDVHMNTHRKNYVCDHCGAPFASSTRLTAHEKTHSTGRLKCPVANCGKVCKLEKYLKKHVDMVHKQKFTINCQHCTRSFRSEHQRHAHIIECHKEYVKSITCEECGDKFNWMKSFRDHMRRRHNTQHVCMECRKCFSSETLLKEHKVTHTGVREVKCLFCPKLYFTVKTMENHLKYMHLQKFVKNDD